ncbi:uncharacterized protein LOC134210368 [Armigeres subalbatus]|uniref:uncharacterized protein LOC134210368 n=1 Tax=Armigeres subalbatus TaxID=124917 RepID=UPI002ED0BE66
MLQNTELGWIVSGKVPDSTLSESQSLIVVCSTSDLQDQLAKFWELETCRSQSTLSVEESTCEEHFDRTTIRDETGRFIVTLPKKNMILGQLGHSETTAIKRLIGMERRFCGNPELKKMYTEFIQEYLELGHMKEAVEEAKDAVTRYYLPHHAVFKPESTTTKLRVVFDASCPTSTGNSLNDALLVGPVLQDDLTSITLRFRTHRIAVNADIAKMYRMIGVQREDHPLQSIKWRNDISEPIRTFELSTVTYGTSSAPYFATKCLHRLADDGESTHPIASRVIRKDFYVDDMLSGVDTLALGQRMRVVVSDVSRLFDPLGLVGPVIIQAKIFIQDLWKDNSDWDEPLNPEHQAQWQEFRRNLTGLENLTVPRWVGTGGNTKTELHGFCDASNKAYGACFYIRTISETGEVCVRLLTAKSRVAPLDNPKKGNKRLSTPRLELSSALLLAHLFEKITNSIGIETKCFFWTDSTIVKCWLASSPSRWKQFIANRVSEIQHITKCGVWNHVAGLENSADIISRGMIPAQLHYESLWFNGPHWLSSDEHNWPSAPQIDEEDFDPSVLETKSITAALPTRPPNEIFSLKSSYTELLRLTAWIQRFCYNSKTSNRNNRRKGQLTVHELDEALDSLVRVSQLECFQQEVADLSMGKEIRESSKLSPLHPELRKGIICVGGRLRHAQIATRRKHPYILDHQHPFTLLIIAHYHRKLLHGGQQLMISAIRERFWPTSIRNLVRKVIHRCIPCFRAKPKVQDQLMADLPPEKVNLCSPFQRVGVDYCGPFQIAYPQRRSRPVKIFIAVYVCLVTKAVHLELASDLSAKAFIATLKRFSSRRGKPEIIMCDNGTNFVGARRQLEHLRHLFNNQQFQQYVISALLEPNFPTPVAANRVLILPQQQQLHRYNRAHTVQAEENIQQCEAEEDEGLELVA